MKKYTLKQRFQYWVDNNVSKGMSRVLAWLVIIIVLIGVIIAYITYLIQFGESTFLEILWDSYASLVNGWVQFFGDAEGDKTYLVAMGVAGVIGLLFASALISIISTAFEDKINSLRKGNSLVLENNHIVILGYKLNEYKLIEEIIEAYPLEKLVIVVADDKDKTEMEDNIKQGIDIPSNVKVICRSIDIKNPDELSCCAIENSRVVILQPMDNNKSVTCIVTLTKLLEGKENKPRIISSISEDKYMFPKSFLEEHGIIQLQTNDMIARIIAHCCTQSGLSKAFVDIFNCDGSELYAIDTIDTNDMCFADVVCGVNGGVPIGILRDGKTMLNPSSELVLKQTDKLIVYSEERYSAHMTSRPENINISQKVESISYPLGNVLVIGYNEVLDTILNEMPSEVEKITLAGINKEQRKTIESFISDSLKERIIYADKPKTADAAEELVKDVNHVVILSNHTKEDEKADVDTMLVLMRLRSVKERLNLNFNITVEMRKESNRKLATLNDETDFIVASDMSSMILSQLAQKPLLVDAFNEILSIQGSEIVLKEAKHYGYEGMKMNVAQLRYLLLGHRCILLGIIENEGNKQNIILNPDLHQDLDIKDEDEFVVVYK